jgi:4'-phosphopantetheinyl transferase
VSNRLLQKNLKWDPYTGQNLLTKDFVHLFKIDVSLNYSKIKPAELLSGSELIKAERFIKSGDRENYIVRKYFLRLILSRFIELAPAAIEFTKIANKKPFLEGVHFNVSHTLNQVIIAVSSSPVGTDTEYINPNFNFNDILASGFSEPEISFVQTGKDPVLNFYTLWTRKEALLKATGEGLTGQLDLVPSLDEYQQRAAKEFRMYSFKTRESTAVSIAFDPEINQIRLWTAITAAVFF